MCDYFGSGQLGQTSGSLQHTLPIELRVFELELTLKHLSWSSVFTHQQRTHSSPLMEQELLYSEAILNDHGRATQIWDAQISCFHMKTVSWCFCSFYGTKKAIIQGKFEIHWWVHGRCHYIKMEEELLYRSEMLSDFWTGGNWQSAMSIYS